MLVAVIAVNGVRKKFNINRWVVYRVLILVSNWIIDSSIAKHIYSIMRTSSDDFCIFISANGVALADIAIRIIILTNANWYEKNCHQKDDEKYIRPVHVPFLYSID